MGRVAIGMRAARSKDEGQFWETLARQLLGGPAQFCLFTQEANTAMQWRPRRSHCPVTTLP